MKITEQQLRDIVRESLLNLYESEVDESLFGLSLDNRVKNGRWRENLNSKNPVISTAYKYGWELSKPDENIDGEYDAKIMSGFANNVEPDRSIEGVAHPKASWPMLIAMLNKELRPQGYVVSGANYRESREDLMGNETNDGYGARGVRGTIIVRKA